MIPMQTNSQENSVSFDRSGLTVLCGDVEHISCKPRVPFDRELIDFLSNVGQELLTCSEAKGYPDVVTFGFFCRKANLIQLAKEYEGKIDHRLGRGMVFHIAPSNVPINFAYSLVAGLLAGNANIVKSSSKDFPQTMIVSDAFNKILVQKEFYNLLPYVNVVQYDRNRQDLTEYFSSICNVRVIWGGDITIEAVRRAAIPPRAMDITFADRYSIAVFDAGAVLELGHDRPAIKALAQNFYNDTYLYDQNACSSPRLIYWLGKRESDGQLSKEVCRAQELFWNAVHENIRGRYEIEPVVAVDKLMAIERTAIKIEGSRVGDSQDNRIVRILVPCLDKALPNLRAAGGVYHEYVDEDLETLADIVDEKYQTLAYFGCDPQRIMEFVTTHGLRGIDRIVPVGHTADFGLVWDGYDMIMEMSRKIVLTIF